MLVVLGAGADPPPGPYFNRFETDTAGWFNYRGATITRVPSGSSSSYANEVAAATGSFYARLGIDPSPDSCTFGGGTAPIYYGPYIKWGGYSAIYETSGAHRRPVYLTGRRLPPAESLKSDGRSPPQTCPPAVAGKCGMRSYPQVLRTTFASHPAPRAP